MTSKQKQAARLRRYRARLRRERLFAHGCYWYRMSEVARYFGKSQMTIWKWCTDGFILTLGYRLRHDRNGRWFIGTQLPLYLDPKPTR